MTNTTATDPDTRPILGRARSAMSGLTTVEAAIRAVVEQLRQARATVRPEEDVAELALSAVLAGDPVPDDLAARVLAIRRSNETAFAEAGVLGPLEHRLREQLLALHRDRVDDALAVLGAELDTVISQAGPVLAELGAVDSADAAINAERVAQWRQAVALSARYGELRQAQRVLVSAAVTPQTHLSDRVSAEARALVDDFGTVVAAGAHYPEVGTGVNRTEVRTGEVRIFSGRLVTSDHSDRAARPRPWLTGDDLVDLRFACRADVREWVPTIKALTDARDEHERTQQAAARAAAERRPGDDDPPFLRTGRRMPPPPAALLDRLAREELGDPA